MGWRKAHGAAGKLGTSVVIETLPADELPRPIPRKLKGGGAMKIVLSRSLTLKVPKPIWLPYLTLAESFRKHQCRELARQAGGVCGAGPSSIIATAALQLAASRYIFDKGIEEDEMSLIKMASGIANDSRQNLLAAYELAIREAQARSMYETSDPHRMLAEALVEEIETPPSLDDIQSSPSSDQEPLPPESGSDKEPRTP